MKRNKVQSLVQFNTEGLGLSRERNQILSLPGSEQLHTLNWKCSSLSDSLKSPCTQWCEGEGLMFSI